MLEFNINWITIINILSRISYAERKRKRIWIRILISYICLLVFASHQIGERVLWIWFLLLSDYSHVLPLFPAGICWWHSSDQSQAALMHRSPSVGPNADRSCLSGSGSTSQWEVLPSSLVTWSRHVCTTLCSRSDGGEAPTRQLADACVPPSHLQTCTVDLHHLNTAWWRGKDSVFRPKHGRRFRSSNS